MGNNKSEGRMWAIVDNVGYNKNEGNGFKTGSRRGRC